MTFAAGEAPSSSLSASTTPTPWHEHFDLSYMPADKRDEARQHLATMEALSGPWPTPILVPEDDAHPAGAGTIYERPGYIVPNFMKDYIFKNRWWTETHTETIGVYAGCLKDNREYGLVHIEYKALKQPNPEPFTRPSVTVSSPSSAGCLKITGADGMLLFLETTGVSATQELSFTFDVSSAMFVR